MIITWGEPLSSTSSTSMSGLTWDECVEECFETADCVIAYNGGTGCQLYSYPQISSVQQLTSSSGSKVAFKVNTTSSMCPIGENPPTFDGNAAYGETSTNNTYQNYTIVYNDASDTWTIQYSSLKTCPSGYNIFSRILGFWCIQVFKSPIESCITQQSAVTFCSNNNAILSGMENYNERMFLQNGGWDLWQNRPVNITITGVWTDGFRISTCLYKSNRTATVCNGINEFQFKDPLLSTPGGITWYVNQPDGLPRGNDTTPTASGCLYMRIEQNQTNLGTIDDTTCDTSTVGEPARLCYNGMACGLKPVET